MSAPDDVDGGWDDGGGDDGGNGGDESGAVDAAAPPGGAGAPADGAPRKRRRRRRGRGGADRVAGEPQGQPSGGAPAADNALQGDPYSATPNANASDSEPRLSESSTENRGGENRGPQRNDNRGQQGRGGRGDRGRGGQQGQQRGGDNRGQQAGGEQAGQQGGGEQAGGEPQGDGGQQSADGQQARGNQQAPQRGGQGQQRGGQQGQQRGGGNQRGNQQQRGGDNRGGAPQPQRGGDNRAGDNRGGGQQQRGSNQPRGAGNQLRGGGQPAPAFNADGTPTGPTPGITPNQRSRRDRGGASGGASGGDRDRGNRGRRDDRYDGPAVDLNEDDVQAQNDLRTRAEDAATAPVPGASVGGALRRNEARRDGDDDEEAAPNAPQEAWGTDDGSPAASISLVSDLPENPPADDLDPSTFPLLAELGSKLGEEVANVVGVRFVPAGRITWFDAADVDYEPAERVLVDAERGSRLGWIATISQRRSSRDRGLRRVIRKATAQDLAGETATDENRTRVLRAAKDKAAALRLPLKVFRVEVGNGKLVVYYTSDERMDLRDFVRDVGQATGLRPELRQLGVRDEAKAVGGIGSCGLTLCCTTWMPDFVPVSIKMAKDQGLVLSPTKVSGQCGRLKCCLVYEQAAYAEMRKGLPKLGKRVVGARGEGRVVEVDVLRQRLRVSYGPGDTEVVPAAEVKALFPPGTQPPRDPREPRADRGPRPPQQPQQVAAELPDDVEDQADDDELDDGPPDPSRDPNAED